MRLTIFHNPEPEPLWEHSLIKLIQPLSYKDLSKMGDIHIAVFNDGVVGISISKNNEIVYLKVRDITRRRGVGKYLIEETIKFISQEYDRTIIDLKNFPSQELDGLIYFLEMQGFVNDSNENNLYFYSEEN